MATLREYYETDFYSCLKLKKGQLKFLNNPNLSLDVEVCVEHLSQSLFLKCYIPSNNDWEKICCDIIEQRSKIIKEISEPISFTSNHRQDITLGHRTHQPLNRVFIYSDNSSEENKIEDINSVALNTNTFLTIRTNSYSSWRNQKERPLAFISHDSRDKNIAIKIADALITRACPVWYDEYSLNIGDSLRESIEKGLKESKKCILICTKNYMNNNGWTKKEFNSIFCRELIESQNVILPIWHDVTEEDIYKYSPELLDRYALKWDETEFGKIISNLQKELIK